MRILIVDDSVIMRAHLRKILAAENVEIRESGDGADAVRQYPAFRPQLVIMDIRMPEMNGIEAIGKIRKMDPAARVIILTEYDDENLRREAREAGALEYVRKDEMLGLPDFVKGISLNRNGS